jgi:hypothetical protein
VFGLWWDVAREISGRKPLFQNNDEKMVRTTWGLCCELDSTPQIVSALSVDHGSRHWGPGFPGSSRRKCSGQPAILNSPKWLLGPRR